MTLDAPYLEYMLKASGGVLVSFGGEKTYGHFETVFEPTLEGITEGVLGKSKSILVKTGSISPTIGDTVIVAGTSYLVRAITNDDSDGGTTRFLLAESS